MGVATRQWNTIIFIVSLLTWLYRDWILYPVFEWQTMILVSSWPIECFSEIFGLVFRAALGSFGLYRKDAQTGSFRGSKSRNKVFVGEPAYGSLPFFWLIHLDQNKQKPLTSHNHIYSYMCLCRTIMYLNKSYIYDLF